MLPGSQPPASPARYRAIVFDLDGTLVESPIDFGAMRQAIRDLGVLHGLDGTTLTPELATPELIGRVHQHLAAAPSGERETFDREVAKRLDEIELAALPGCRPIPGAREALEALRGRGASLGLLTRGGDRYALRALRKARFTEFFPVVTTRDSPGPPKPDPASLRRTLRNMEASVTESIFVGDHPLDLVCARGAAVDFIGFVWPEANHTSREAEFAGAGGCPIVHSYPELMQFLSQAKA